METPQPDPSRFKADSLGDVFNLQHTWASILEPHGWTLVNGDGDEPRSQWLSPFDPDARSFTGVVRTMRLVVIGHTEQLGPEVQGGLSKFQAFSILNHGGDDHAAATAIVTSNGRQG
jgi:hypothetical protein